MKSYILMWKKGLNFSGRSTRSEYWYAMLINMLLMLIVYGIFFAFTFEAMTSTPIDTPTILANSMVLYIILGIYGLASFLPQLSLTVRRLHDVGLSGFWLLYTVGISFILGLFNMVLPELIVGILGIVAGLSVLGFWIYVLVKDSQPFENKYGADPKGRNQHQE